MNATPPRDSRLDIPCDPRTRQLLDQAAAIAQVSVTEFVLTQARASAERILQTHESITLSPTDFQAFLDLLDAPPEPNQALARAFQRHRQQVQP
jgi:uncharacterized protein (DUF1778 family)